MTYINYPEHDNICSVTANYCVQLVYRLTGSQTSLLLSLSCLYFHCGTVATGMVRNGTMLADSYVLQFKETQQAATLSTVTIKFLIKG